MRHTHAHQYTSLLGNRAGSGQGGTDALRASLGWTDGESCAGGGLYRVNFNIEASWTDQTGISFFNETTGFSAAVTTLTAISTTQIDYTADWGANPAPQNSDVVKFIASAGNNYTYLDSNGVVQPMSPQDVKLVNCADSSFMLFPLNERKGTVLTDIYGAEMNPASVPNGYIAFEVPNAVRIEADTGGDPFPLTANVTLDMRKVTVFAGAITNLNNNGSRINMGQAAINNAFSISGTSSLHSSIGSDTDIFQVTPGGLALPDNTDMAIYGFWDGVGSSGSAAGRLYGACINDDGSIINFGGNDLINDGTGIIVADTLLLAQESRLRAAQYYNIGMWQFDYVPANLDKRVGEWARQARLGNKLTTLPPVPPVPPNALEWTTGDTVEWATGDNLDWS